jgi:hypothetical protein
MKKKFVIAYLSKYKEDFTELIYATSEQEAKDIFKRKTKEKIIYIQELL